MRLRATAGTEKMIQDIRDAIVYVLMIPVRMYRAVVERLVALRRFLNVRRRHLAIGIIVSMMAIVGVKLRYTGYADSKPVEYAVNSVPDTTAIDRKIEPARRAVTTAVADSITSAKVTVASFTAKAKSPPKPRPLPRPQVTRPIERPDLAMTTASSHPIMQPRVPARDQTLILPMPKVVQPPPEVLSPYDKPILPDNFDKPIWDLPPAVQIPAEDPAPPMPAPALPAVVAVPKVLSVPSLPKPADARVEEPVEPVVVEVKPEPPAPKPQLAKLTGTIEEDEVDN